MHSTWCDSNYISYIVYVFGSCGIQSKVLLPLKGLRITVPTQPPPMIFATPTKYVSEAGNMVEYLGHNKVPDLQKLFQVQTHFSNLCLT